jgi:hypothetical protein
MFRSAPLALPLAAAALALSGTAAYAAEPLQPLEEVNAGDEHIITGGVGEPERQAMLDRVSEFDLLVSFARRDDGNFLSDVDVVLTHDGKKPSVIDLTTAGPFMFAKLPAGHYELTASLPGWRSVHRAFDVDPFRRQRLYIVFEPEQPAAADDKS